MRQMTMTKKLEFTDAEWEKIKTNGTFCPAPFNSYYIHTDGSLGACCVHRAPKSGDKYGTGEPRSKIEGSTNKDIVNAYNTKSFKDLRKDLLNGVKNSQCEYCWKGEAVNTHSMRHAMLGWMDQWEVGETIRNAVAEDYTVDEPEINYLDVRFDNTCNLRCRSCGPEYSSTWYPEELEMVEKKIIVNNNLTRFHKADVSVESLKQNLRSCHRIYFAGGEPLIMPQHYEILDYFLELGNTDIDIFYNTNFSKLTHSKFDVIEYWKKFKRVTVSASLDGSYKRGEYARKNLSWEQVVKNRERMIAEVPHVKFIIGATLSIMTAYNIVDFHREWVNLGYVGPGDIIVNLLFGPEHWCISNLPDHHKAKLTELYEEQIKWLSTFADTENPTSSNLHNAIQGYQSAIDILKNPAKFNNLITAGWRRELWLDNNRKEDFFEVFPEYIDLKPMITGQ